MRDPAWAVGQLRHLYRLMMAGHAARQAEAARGLLGPAIEALEPLIPVVQAAGRVQEQLGEITRSGFALDQCRQGKEHLAGPRKDWKGWAKHMESWMQSRCRDMYADLATALAALPPAGKGRP
jgi:hypothetical protein